jgi:hypothetical protein
MSLYDSVFAGQFWADYTQDATAASAGPQGYAQNFYLLRARLWSAVPSATRSVSFFRLTIPNSVSPAGATSTKTLTTGNVTSPGFIMQDGFMEYRVHDHLQIAAGEMIVPNSRQALQSPISYHTVNISQ